MRRNNTSSELLKKQGYFGEEIITGEAVALEMPSTTVVTRLASAAIDALTYGVCMVYCIYVLSQWQLSLSFATSRTLVILTIASWTWIIPALLCGLTRGSSLGRLATRTRVVRTDGGSITLRQSFIRSALSVVECWICGYAIGSIVMLFNNRAQRLGDMAAGTYVVRWPKGRKTDHNLGVSPRLQAWAEVVQTREAPSGLILNISNHFRSIAKLDPRARAEQARVLAAATEKYVSPPPPWGTDPEEFIAAFVTVRHGVEYSRANATRNRRARLTDSLSRIPFSVQ
ncbi:RDD family protein [Arcanobacterium bovis]|uniref:RDD family protein n=1 Tax=Arcanobacterium bovis TaxID=2529275 RepID=A0A4Q9V3E8_9ACTO|nr:RDD family protein [Arcanobacterium bovis]TBW23623.1 RDD family protein [Arcanobacterium bovis]